MTKRDAASRIRKTQNWVPIVAHIFAASDRVTNPKRLAIKIDHLRHYGLVNSFLCAHGLT